MVIIDSRYHIASLVAVFLALGIGILIGSAVLGNDAIVNSQKKITDRLESQLTDLRQKNDEIQTKTNALETDNNAQKQFEKQVLPVLIQGKLTGQSIAIVETNSYGFSDDLEKLLVSAGAKIQSVTTIVNGFDISQDKDKLAGELGIKADNQDELVKRLMGEISRGILAGDNLALLNQLAQDNLIKMSGDYGLPLNGVIFIGGSQDKALVKPDTIDLPMIDYFLQQKIPVFGVEESDVAYSYMAEYQKKRITTVDNIDTTPGQFSLVLAMAGKPGHYGVKSTAQQLTPSLDGIVGGVSTDKTKQ